MLYHCLRRWPNIKTTLDRRLVISNVCVTVGSLPRSITVTVAPGLPGRGETVG